MNLIEMVFAGGLVFILSMVTVWLSRLTGLPLVVASACMGVGLLLAVAPFRPGMRRRCGADGVLWMISILWVLSALTVGLGHLLCHLEQRPLSTELLLIMSFLMVGGMLLVVSSVHQAATRYKSRRTR